MKYFLLVILMVNLSCSVNSPTAKENLLDIRNPLGKPTDETQEAGEMSYTGVGDNPAKGNSFSVFLWPNSPIEPHDQMSQEISTMSLEIDHLTKSYREGNDQVIREEAYWLAWACDDNADAPTGKPDVQACELIFPKGTKHDFCACIANNKPLLKKQGEDNINARLSFGKKIKFLIEGGDVPAAKNWLLSETAGGSTLKLIRSEGNESNNLDVYLKFINFGPENTTYKTPKETPTKEIETQQKGEKVKAIGCDEGLEIYTKKNGTQVCIPKDTKSSAGRILSTEYNTASKLLKFVLYEKSKGEPTGNTYHFEMERGIPPEGSPELVRFKGGFKKIGLLGQTLGMGSAKFDGEWTVPEKQKN